VAAMIVWDREDCPAVRSKAFDVTKHSPARHICRESPVTFRSRARIAGRRCLSRFANRNWKVDHVNDALRKQREFDEKTRELEITIEKRVHASQAVLIAKARQDVADELKAQVSQKDTQMSRSDEQSKS
jgi:hypothetical protein